MPRISVSSHLPLQVEVDFQSRHRAGFRLFTRERADQDWKFVKEGIADTATILTPMRAGGAIKYEFLFFTESHPFAAVIVFRQNGQMVENGLVSVEAPGNSQFITDTVELV